MKKEMENVNINGLSQFFWFAIPAVLALAAIMWLTFGQGMHYFRRALSQEKRHAEVVGASPLPKVALEIELANARDSAIRINKAEIDGDDLWIYVENSGHSKVDFVEYEWRLSAPDGTIVKSDRHFIPGSTTLEAGEKREIKAQIASDPRASKLIVKVMR